MANIIFNPIDKSVNTTLSNNNLTVTRIASSFWESIRASASKSAGKWYWEVTSPNAGDITFGIASSTSALTGSASNQMSGRLGFLLQGYKEYESSQTAYGSAASANDIIGVALDLDNKKLEYYKNGVSMGVAFTTEINNLGTNIFPIVSIWVASGSATVNFGASLFKYAIPTGYLPYEPNNFYLRVKAKLDDVKNIGDMISSRYTALTSGQVGIFSELGTTLAALIPGASSATPNGSFYWVYIGKDYLGRKKFIADRNIQHSISWDVLNSNGICSEKSIDLGLGLSIRSTIRLLIGGNSAIDIDNEWDKIIVNSTLKGVITAGDNNIWNWLGISSWTNSTGTTSANRIFRGNSVVGTTNAPTGTVSSTLNSTLGFRPVLLVETLQLDKFLLKKDNNYYTLKDTSYYDNVNHIFIPLILSGGSAPNESDIDNFGFNSLLQIITSMTKGSDSFIPANKLQNFDIEYYSKT